MQSDPSCFGAGGLLKAYHIENDEKKLTGKFQLASSSSMRAPLTLQNLPGS